MPILIARDKHGNIIKNWDIFFRWEIVNNYIQNNMSKEYNQNSEKIQHTVLKVSPTRKVIQI